MSSIYYAMFHCLARDCADLLIGSAGADRSMEAWQQVYRSLEHGIAKDRCKKKDMIKKFPKQIEDFANAFATMQEKRHRADYDPSASFTKSEVAADVALVEQTILDYRSVSSKHRRAFCAYVLLKQRPDETAIKTSSGQKSA